VKVFRDGNSWGGKMVTMPFNKSIYLYYLNMDRLAAAGFTTAPKTQMEYAAAVQKCTLREDGRTKMYGLGIQPRSEALTTLLFARGGRYTDESGKITLATPEAVASLALLKSLQSPEKNIYINPDFLSQPFTNQQIATYIYSSASLPYNKQGSAGKFRYEAAPVPAGEGADPRYLIQGTNIGIFKNHPEPVRKAAWKLVKFLTSTKNSAYFETRSGYMPIRYSILKDPQMADHLAKNPDYAVAASLVLSDKGRQEPRFAAWEGVRADLDSLVDTVLSKGTDPKQALEDLQVKVDAKLGKGK
jgi:multiple sugar transport system substrate-binding protein